MTAHQSNRPKRPPLAADADDAMLPSETPAAQAALGWAKAAETGDAPTFHLKAEPFAPEAPQPLLREIAPAVAFPAEALGPLRKAVEAVQDISQAPVAIAAQSALAVASLAVQGFANVETLGGDVPCSLFCLTVAESGERKSTCDKLLMKALRGHERDGLVRPHRAHIGPDVVSLAGFPHIEGRLI